MSPLHEFNAPNILPIHLTWLIKRDDLLPSPISGNKWRKLKYLIAYMENEDKKEIITWGGAYSNHLFACSWLVKHMGYDVIGIMPKNSPSLYPPSLVQAISNGLKIKEVSRTEYRKRFDPDYLQELNMRYPNKIILAEGGTSEWSDQGTSEIVHECQSQRDTIDYWVIPVGSGGTLRGMVTAQPKGKIIGINVVKGSDPSHNIIRTLGIINQSTDWTIIKDYDLGGMGKSTPKFISFLNTFYHDTQIKLDPIYNGKMMYALSELAKNNYFRKGSTICAVHTGGQSGIDNYHFKHPDQLIY